MPTIGYFLGSAFESLVTNIDHWIAFILLGIIGGNMIKEAFCKEKEKIRIEIAHVGNIDADFGFVYKGIGKLCKDQAIIRTRQSHAQSRWEQKWTSQPTTQLQWLE